jgi:hypothetical protein
MNGVPMQPVNHLTVAVSMGGGAHGAAASQREILEEFFLGSF